MFKENVIKNIKVITFLIFLAVTAFALTLYVYTANANDNCIVTENVYIIKNRYVVQGDVSIFKIYDEKILLLKDETKVEIINSKGTVVGTAYINGDEILVDTSLLLTGKYRIKISNSLGQVVTKDSFTVSLITVR